ncbi:MAG: ATP-binding protein [Prevotella sp.]|nr:ATP-binding protein [Prevotella sp.]
MTQKTKSIQILTGETSEVEYKSARGGFPASFWETYSAFANTDGGTIFLGVQEKDGNFLLDNLSEDVVRKYQKIFWDNAHNRSKVSTCLPLEGDVRVEDIDGSFVLVCRIPRAPYGLRPVYLTPNPLGHTFRRNHEGDYLCTDTEVRRMFADAEYESHPQDSIIRQGFTLDNDIDLPSLHQYRQMLISLHPTHPWGKIMDDRLFMEKIGAYVTNAATGEHGITRAGLLMFGKSDSIVNPAGEPFYFVDYRERLYTEDPNIRWTDRIYPDGTWEANLFQFYLRVYNKLIQVLPKPFKLVGDARIEETMAHNAVREALVNAIIHQDINAHGNIVVTLNDHEMTFSNPGMMLVSRQQYFKGGRSICRNTTLQKMFMMLGRAEKAGSGVDKIVAGWKELKWGKPVINEETQPDYVQLTLPVKTVKATIPHKNPTRTISIFEQSIQKILEFCQEPKSADEIKRLLGLRDSKNFKQRYLKPLLESGYLVMTEPEVPTSRNQKYFSKDVL